MLPLGVRRCYMFAVASLMMELWKARDPVFVRCLMVCLVEFFDTESSRLAAQCIPRVVFLRGATVGSQQAPVTSEESCASLLSARAVWIANQDPPMRPSAGGFRLPLPQLEQLPPLWASSGVLPCDLAANLGAMGWSRGPFTPRYNVTSCTLLAAFLAAAPSQHVVWLLKLWLVGGTCIGHESRIECTAEVHCGRLGIGTNQSPLASRLRSATLSSPRGVHLTDSATPCATMHYFVCDAGTGSVLRIGLGTEAQQAERLDGVLRVAGCGTRTPANGYPADGPLTVASFHDLRGICGHPERSADLLFVQDGLAIRCVDIAGGVVRTLTQGSGVRSLRKMARMGSFPTRLEARSVGPGGAAIIESIATISGTAERGGALERRRALLCTADSAAAEENGAEEDSAAQARVAETFAGALLSSFAHLHEIRSSHKRKQSLQRERGGVVMIGALAWQRARGIRGLPQGRLAVGICGSRLAGCIVASDGSGFRGEFVATRGGGQRQQQRPSTTGSGTITSQRHCARGRPTSSISPYVAQGLKRANERCLVGVAARRLPGGPGLARKVAGAPSCENESASDAASLQEAQELIANLSDDAGKKCFSVTPPFTPYCAQSVSFVKAPVATAGHAHFGAGEAFVWTVGVSWGQSTIIGVHMCSYCCRDL